MQTSFDLDLKRWCLMRNGQEQRLRRQTFKVLRYFVVERPAAAVTRQELLKILWPAHVRATAVDQCVKEIRQILGDSSKQPEFLETVQGRGYRFIGCVSQIAEERWRLSPRSTSIPSDQKPIENLPYIRNPFFTGRDTILQTLFDAFNQSHGTTVIPPQALSGLGGIGKTQTAIEYAHRYSDQYQAIFWVRADTELELRTGFVDIAQLLTLPMANRQDLDETIHTVKQWLETHTQWLLVFDNANQLAILKPFLPRRPMGHVLLTSRVRSFDTLGILMPIYIEEWSPEEALAFLWRRTGRRAIDYDSDSNERNAAMALVEELGYLPLALEHAGAFIKAHATRFTDYLTSYRYCDPAEIFPSDVSVRDYPTSVLTTWTLNFRQVETDTPEAADILRLSAFLYPYEIPLDLIARSVSEFDSHLQTRLAEVDRDPLGLYRIIAPLHGYSLIRPAAHGHTFSVHPLVQTAVKAQLPADVRHVWATRAIRAVCITFEHAKRSSDWPLSERLLPHAETALRLARQYDLAPGEVRTLERSLVVPLYTRLNVKRLNAFLRDILQRNEVFLVPLLRIPVAKTQANALRKWMATLDETIDGNELAEARWALAYQEFFSGQLDHCHAQLDALLQQTETNPSLNPMFRFLTLTLKANSVLKQGELNHAERLSQHCVQEAPQGFVQPRGQAYWILAEVHMYRGDLEAATKLAQTSLEIGQEYPAAHVFCKASLGLIAAYQGYVEVSKQYSRQAVEIALTLGPFELGHAYFYAGKAAQVLMHLEEAYRYLNHAYRSYHKYRFRFHKAWCDFERLHTQFLLDQYPARALTHFVVQVIRHRYEKYLTHWLNACANTDWKLWISRMMEEHTCRNV